jgi:hypothetical protein
VLVVHQWVLRANVSNINAIEMADAILAANATTTFLL